MTDEAQPAGAERTARFEAALRADRASGRKRPIGEYLAEFPDLAFHIADRLAELRVEEFATRTRSGSRSGPAGDAAAGELRRLGHYRIERELGRGGQGIVYLAEDENLRRRVALKVISIGPTQSGEAVARFKKEAEAAARVDHPGVCSVYEAGVAGGAAFLAMRYVEGETLANVIARRRDASRASGWRELHGASARDETLRVVEAAARALHAAHAKGVIHRDIKPANVMIGRDGDPVILDFGLAREDDPAAPSLTATKDAVGTPAYMAPEQVRSGAGRPDHRVDVYALGAVLYEMLLLRRPFEAPTRELLYRAILLEEPTGLGRGSGTLPADVRVVLATALEKDRDRRYRTALDLAEDLARLRAGQPLRARPPGAWRRFVLWRRRHPTAAALVAFAVVATTAFVVSQHQSIEALRESRDDERRQRTKAEGLRFASESVVQAERDPALALGLALEASARSPGIESRNALYGALLKNRERLTFLGHDDQVTACALTPDDQTAITGDASGLLLAWDVATGRVRARVEGPAPRPLFAVCSPDGTTACFSFRQDGVWLWRWAEPGALVRIPEISQANALTFDRAGKLLLAAAYAGECVVWDLAAARVVHSSRGADLVGAALSADGARLVEARKGALAIRDLASGATLEVATDPQGACVAHPSEPLFAATEGADVVIRKFADGSALATLPGGGDVRMPPRFLGDGSRIFLQSLNRVFTWADGKTAVVLEAPPAPDVGGWAWIVSPDGRRLIAWGGVETGAAGVWDDSGRSRGALRGPRYWIANAAASSDSTFAVVASRDGTARVYSLDEPLQARRQSTAEPQFCAFDATGRLIGEEPCQGDPLRRRLVAFDGFGPEPPRDVRAGVPPAASVYVDLARTHAMQIDRAGSFAIVDLAAGSEICRGELSRSGLAVGPDGFSPADFSTVSRVFVGRVWGPKYLTYEDFAADFDGARPPRRIRAGLQNYVRMKLSPDGTRALTADGEQRTATVFDTATGAELAKLAGHSGWVVDAEWSPDGSRIATTAVDTSVRVWRASDYALERTLHGLKMAEPRVAFSFDGRLVATLAGGQVNLFDAATGEALAALDAFGPRSEEGSPCFTSDGKWLLLLLTHESLRLPLDPVAYARAHLPRPLDARELARFGAATPEARIEVLARQSADQPSARNDYTEGLARLDAGDQDGARRAFAAAVALRPSHRFGHHGLALVAAAEGKSDECLAELEKAARAGGLSADDLRSDQRLARVRADPRFEALLQSLK